MFFSSIKNRNEKHSKKLEVIITPYQFNVDQIFRVIYVFFELQCL
jgi:hypothetical protein